jgi:hypothetical protein
MTSGLNDNMMIVFPPFHFQTILSQCHSTIFTNTSTDDEPFTVFKQYHGDFDLQDRR